MWHSTLSQVFKLADFNTGSCNPQNFNGHKFFGFPHWWAYIKEGRLDGLGHCLPLINFPSGLLGIGLAVTSMLLYLAGLVAVFAIIAAGVMYMLAGGNPEKAASARKRLYNAIIGLVIVFISAPIVTFLGHKLG
jgi:hypothetical protein